MPARLRGVRPFFAGALVAAFVAAFPGQAVAAPAPTIGLTPSVGCALAPSAAWDERLTTLAPHPRVILGTADRAAIETAANSPEGSDLRTYHDRFMSRALDFANQPIPDFTSENLNGQAAAAVHRFTYIGYRLLSTEEPELADRIRAEVAGIVALPYWNTDHFLDTAHAATAVSLGYTLTSWRMDPDERARTLDALETKAITPATCLWAKKDFMVSSTDNWGVVTNAALAMAALVVADVNRPLAAAVIAAAVPRLNAALATMTDGGTYEGPMYANYMGQYAAFASASMARSLRFGSQVVRRVPNSAKYRLAMAGPSKLPFNHSDSDAARQRDLLSVWNAYDGGDPAGAWYARQSLAENLIVTPLFLLWDSGEGTAPTETPTATALPRSGVVSMRSDWSDTASWLAMKGGTNGVNHAQLELGTFVLEMGGQRFVSEFGRDSYALPNYFVRTKRAMYFRCATASASTLSRAGVNQSWAAVAPIVAPVATGTGWRGGVDLSTLLGVKSAQRRATVQRDGVVSVVDTVTAAKSTPLRWTANTQADVVLSVDRRTATLTRGGVVVAASLAARTTGTFRVVVPPVTLGGLSNTSFRQLVVDSSASVKSGATFTGSIGVTFTQVPSVVTTKPQA